MEQNQAIMGIEQAFERVFSRMYKAGEFNGVVLVATEGEISFSKAYGIADIEQERPLKTDSIFNLASISKQVTALCIMILAERGVLEYDEPITNYLDELPYEDVTIRHLLQHTSGLPAYEEVLEEYWEGDEEEDFITNDDLIALYADNELELDSSPNKKYEYSNTGYVFLASIVERASGLSFEDFVRENIAEPLGLQNFFAFRRPNKAPKRVVQGFSEDGDEREDYSYNFIDGMVGDGNVFASAEDLAAYTFALFGGQIIEQETFQEALEPARLKSGKTNPYGFGWELESDTFVSHTGCWEGYNTYLGVDIESEYVFIVLSSGDNSEIHDGIAKAMAEFYE